MADDPELRAHREWLGYLQPVGVVVSPPALTQAQAHVNRNVAARQAEFAEHVVNQATEDGSDVRVILDIAAMLRDVMGWSHADLVPASDARDLEVVLPEYNDLLRPDFAVPEPEPVEGGSRWQLVVVQAPPAADLDSTSTNGHGWDASPQARLERLLRETGVPAGLLCNGTAIRLVYAPRGESSGYLTFPVAPMTEVAGRPIFAALEMLLGYERFFTLPREQRLPGLLVASRRYQNEVSIKLAGQVLAALYELLRGMQAADNQAKGRLLSEVLRTEPDQVYNGLLSILLRLVFLLFAEDRGLMPSEEVFTSHYSVGGLYERLRADAGQHPDTMDQRYGAWAHLLALFRLVYDGTRHGGMRLPARHGHLFDPDRFTFLEGRPWRISRVPGERIEAPLISDGVVFRVLQSLLVLDGERLSYRSLDVEQIGSVYETMMGFGLGLATGPSVAIQPGQRHGAPIVVDLAELLGVASSSRAKWLQDETGRKVTTREATAMAHASSVDELLVALESKIDRRATPNVVPPSAMVLQPGEERRRSGSHYTPRSLTEPIVRRTLEPVLLALGDNPTPAAILDLKVLDPAMGSGAFLVEAARQLGEVLTSAWHRHGEVPEIPTDEGELLLARRMVAQSCLYGVDRNPMATDLAKLSLWLATLARDHAFTFIDHTLRTGDSLIGATRQQIAGFDWAPGAQTDVASALVSSALRDADAFRRQIRESADADDQTLREILNQAEAAVADARLVGDLLILAFFSADSDQQRQAARSDLASDAAQIVRGDSLSSTASIALGKLQEAGLIPFHWEIEFPEVFDRDQPGFDAIVGNPPFMSGRRISTNFGSRYLDFLLRAHPGAGNLCDLVAHFYRSAFSILRSGGAFGLVATNTIAQGDTRDGGLGWITAHDGYIYSARKRVVWPGAAAVITSQVHVIKEIPPARCDLDGQHVPQITSFLFDKGGNQPPVRLSGRSELYSLGSKIYGQGFIFSDGDNETTPLAVKDALLAARPDLASRIFSYITGEDFNHTPEHVSDRFVIYLSDLGEERDLQPFSELVEIVRRKVKPVRDALGSNANNIPLKRRWWAYQAHRPAFYAAVANLGRILAISRTTQHFAFDFVPTGAIYSEGLVLFAMDSAGAFALLQSRVHEVWARFLSSTMADALRYAASDAFATFPFSDELIGAIRVHETGELYQQFRSQAMLASGEGLTQTYSRFHDPGDRTPDTTKMRELHDAMDRAVLDAYGWSDLPTTCAFLLDYEEEGAEGLPEGRRKPWRYRWPDEIRDEVLARLLQLNNDQAEAEAMAGPQPKSSRRRGPSAKIEHPRQASDVVQPPLLAES